MPGSFGGVKTERIAFYIQAGPADVARRVSVSASVLKISVQPASPYREQL